MNATSLVESTQLIKRFCLERAERGAQLPVPTEDFYTGSAYPYDVYTLRVSSGFKLQDNWSDGFREVYVNPVELAVFTYCEGDLDLTIDSNVATFKARLKLAEEFYENA